MYLFSFSESLLENEAKMETLIKIISMISILGYYHYIHTTFSLSRQGDDVKVNTAAPANGSLSLNPLTGIPYSKKY